jgi:hypothetical protein
VRPEMRCVAVAAALLVDLWGSGVSRAAEKPNPCPTGQDAVTITFSVPAGGGECAVEGNVPDACVSGGASIHWTLVNRNCDFDEARTAIEMSAPKLKKDKSRSFNWDCTPKKNGWAKGKDEKLSCKVPKGTDDGVYKYSLSGQIKPLDPDIEVRRGN